LVSTPSNFGLSGKPPTHPELLDWLATELVDRNWKMKARFMKELMIYGPTILPRKIFSLMKMSIDYA
jgi:hypothetical protein